MMMEPLRTVLTPMARELLRVAHLEYDLYFRGFLHNHLCHGIVSLTAIVTTTSSSVKEEEEDTGLTATVVSDEEMKAHYTEQIKMYESRHRHREQPSENDSINNAIITTENWYERVLQPGGGVNMSGNFLNFFDEEINNKYNKDDDDKTVLSQMLTKYALDPRLVSRLLGGAVHPLIHLGFACELFAMEPETSKLLLVEALAMQCTTRNQFGAVLESLEPLSVVNEKEKPLTADENRVLQVLHAMQQDGALVNVPTPENPDKVDYIVSRTDVMSKYYNSFPVSESSPEGVQLAFEQLFFAALAIVFGSIPSAKAKDARLDFFLVHLLTSAVSLRQVLPYLDTKAGAALCRLHFCAILVWYRARGHPSLNMENLLLILPTTLTWDACETKLRENPGMEVHALKVFRALKLVKSEEWAQRALVHCGAGGGLLPGATTTKTAVPANDEDMWLICANVLVQNVERDSEFPWLFNDAWNYYNS